ncbi:unnamed protein product [Rotaria magnacalcarata]|nr:unnamed protein product [Rotaria magnacalcarata]CAF2053866.1 unnamed protein product [Rotaria magnacalcarata]CAF3818181.1 unnamed protein product [Rotaria magnacalcarata]
MIIKHKHLSTLSPADNAQVYSRPGSDNKSNILIVCFGIDTSSILLDSYGQIEYVQDECACIARLLSTTDERVYFIASASNSQNIIPLVYDHRCIEQIYLYCSNDEEKNAKWISQIPIIQSCYASFSEINSAVSKDIESMLVESFAWSENELLRRCYTQTLVDSAKWSSVSLNISNVVHNLISNGQIRIVVLHCGRHILFQATGDRSVLAEFYDSTRCSQYLVATDVRSIFFIIAGGIRSVMHDLQAITTLKQAYTVYVFLHSMEQNDMVQAILQYENVNGLFCDIEAVFTRVAEDIKFFAEQSLYTPISSIFASSNYTIDKFGFNFLHEQNKFVASRLFTNILQQIPSSNYYQERLHDRCLTFAENQSTCESALKQVMCHTVDQLLDWIVNAPFLTAIMNSLLQQQAFNSLLDIRQLIAAVDQNLIQQSAISSSLVVYRVQLIQAHDLERIKKSIDQLIAFHTFLLTTKNILTAREIARQAANSELLAIIFEIDVPATTPIAQFDEDRFIFRFGFIFRIRSINLAPDGVWHAQLRCADSNFEFIQEQLEIQLGVQVTWLTFGNYLRILNNSDQAKSYYEYLLKMLPDNHEALPSIYNNIGLMLEELGDREEASKYYKLSLDSMKQTTSNTNHCAHHIRYKVFHQLSEAKETVNRCKVYEKIAEIHQRRLEPQQALEFYRKALEQTVDPLSRLQFEQKIQETLSLV